ncbi:MAG TPA: alpha-ketoglutarate-dependent dioxygenase AlkB [Usitatibacter sp.]|nr:alpha-ketoglutarate-dependent dioxygenase AlkB [Usitatibacter sp.]
MQSALFDEPAGLPNGLAFVPEFIGREEERALLEAIPAVDFTHALVSEYRPGTQLGWHRDVPQFESIVGVSLAADARMRFRPWPPRKGDALFALDLPPRSAYLLRGEVRWGWQHSVAPTRALRYSITFRTSAKGR